MESLQLHRASPLFAVLAVLLAACGSGGSAPSGEVEGPVPIIIVDLDTLRADHLGCYGYDQPTSPHLDRFAAEAAHFRWAFAQGPATPPSQASILTGLYPTTHGRIHNKDKVAEGVTTLAEALRGAGYATAAFVDGGLMAAGFGLEQGFDLYDDEAGRLRTIGPKAERWLENDAPDGPFLLLVHTYDVHSPYEDTPEPFRSMFLGGLEMPSPEFRANVTGTISKVFDTRHQDDPLHLTPEEIAYAVALYDGGIRHVDDWFGGFVDFLKERGLYDRSIVVVISDHGEEFQEHGSFLHDKLYATVTRVPMLVRFPGGHYRGPQEAVVETIDLVPTLLEQVGVPIPEPMHGRSLLPLLRGERVRPELAVSESPNWGRRVAVADAELRLLTAREKENPEVELYRYRDDPLEQREMRAEAPEHAERMLRAVEGWETLVELDAFEGGEVEELDEETLEQLRALGYLQ